MSEATPVVVTYLRSQLQACHEAIQSIWVAANEKGVTDLQRGANLDQAIWDAYQKLPPEMRDSSAPDTKPNRQKAKEAPKPAADFEDLLG